MVKFTSRIKSINSGDLRTPVTFFQFAPKPGPDPGEMQKRALYSCFAEVQKVWMRDLEQAKANNTLNDITVRIRDPLDDYTPSNKHHLSVEHRGYEGQQFNIKSVQPDTKNAGFLVIVAGAVT